MKRLIIFVLLLSMQIYFIYEGALRFGADLNPFYLFITSLIIPGYYLRSLLRQNSLPYNNDINKKYAAAISGALIGFISIAVCYFTFKAIINALPDPAQQSDVLPQLVGQYDAFSKGRFPYFPLEQFAWHPYPVYMPLHWLPVGIGVLLNKDPRWVGFLLLFIAAGIYGYYLGKNNIHLLKKIVAIILPAIAFFASIKIDGIDYSCTFETVIAAYYLLLVTGLSQRNLTVTTIGIICCVLSRYTLVFWLPLFFILLWFNTSPKKNFIVWGSIILSVLLIYVFPFYMEDHTIFSKGINYHNVAVVGEWKGFEAVPRTGWTFDSGINFALYFYKIFPGDVEHKVYLSRIVQAACMLLLFFGGLFFYRKWRKQINFYDFSLVMLYLFLLFFFMFGPLTYKYYYLPLLMISAVICGKAILLESPQKQQG